MFISLKCNRCKYQFSFINGFCGIHNYVTYKCNECKRYFVAMLPYTASFEDRKISFYDSVRAIAVYDGEREKAHTFMFNKVYCEECGGQNIEVINQEDVMENNHIVKLKCLCCGNTLSYVTSGPFDG
ncbi:MAG: hypothetical protein E7273_06265 [Pseudobutyrivibrio ruminis]|nr:hypothetical protein [Pseudobutyrivibrio ruminis]